MTKLWRWTFLLYRAASTKGPWSRSVRLEDAREFVDQGNGCSIHLGPLSFEDFIPTPMKTGALIWRKQTMGPSDQ